MTKRSPWKFDDIGYGAGAANSSLPNVATKLPQQNHRSSSHLIVPNIRLTLNDQAPDREGLAVAHYPFTTRRSYPVPENISTPSFSSYGNLQMAIGPLESLSTVWDTQNDTAFGFDTNAASSKQQSHAELDGTTAKQRNFMRVWYEGLRRERGSMTPLSKEHVSALATLIDLQPQIVHNWITRNLITGANKDEQAANRSLANTTISDPQTPTSSISENVNGAAEVTPGKKHKFIPGGPGGDGRYIEIDIVEPAGGKGENHKTPTKNISSETLQLIENHIRACNSRRRKVDDRRRANTGKYECTFNCGYRTKRAFDWKRHEESHQPQDFWLCSICNQEERTDFLVHRTDKLRMHIQNKHASSNLEDVVKSSELAFKAGFKSQCGFCGCTFEFWEERNKHILYHFDAEGRAARNMSQWREPWYDDDSDEYTSDEDPEYPGQSARLEDITSHLVELNPHEGSLATLPDLRKLETPQSKGSPRETLPPLQGPNSPIWNGPNQGSKLPSFHQLDELAEVGSNFLDYAIVSPPLPVTQLPLLTDVLHLPPVEPKLANDSQAARADDIQSVLSLRTFNDSAFYSSQRSSVGSDAPWVPKTAKEQVLNILSSDQVLKPWFATAAQKVDRDRFVRNVRRLIGRYYLDLLKEVQDVRERNAVQILRDNVFWFAVSLQETFDPQAPSRKVYMQEALERQTFDRLYLLERHLASTTHSEVMETKDDKTNDTISVVDSFEDDPEPIDYTRFPNIAHIRTFLTGGVAFHRLRENLHCFVSGQAMEIDEPIDRPNQEPAGREVLELPSDRPTKRGLKRLLDGNGCSNPRKRQLHQTSLGPKIGELAEAMSYNNSDQDETHSPSSPLSPSTEITNITRPSAPRSIDDISNEETSEIGDLVEDSDDRFLNPTGYFNKLKSLRLMVFENSAIQQYSHFVTIPTTEGEPAISIHRAPPPIARINECNVQLRIPFHPNEWLEMNTSDDSWLEACSRTSSRQIFDLLECRNLIVRVYSSLKSLQKAEFCGSFFSVLVLDKYRPAVARLVPIQITSVEFLVQLFHTTLTAIGHVALSSSNSDISDGRGTSFMYDLSSPIFLFTLSFATLTMKAVPEIHTIPDTTVHSPEP